MAEPVSGSTASAGLFVERPDGEDRFGFAEIEPDHLLVGHGEGICGPSTSETLQRALDRSRRGLPGLLVRLPFSLR